MTQINFRASARIKYTQMTPDFCSPILYKIRQGASDSATLLVVISDATQNTDKKTSKIVYFILAEVLICYFLLWQNPRLAAMC